MAEPKKLTLKHLRELAKKHLGSGSSKLKTRSELVLALKPFEPQLMSTEPAEPEPEDKVSAVAASRVLPAKIIRFKSARKAMATGLAGPARQEVREPPSGEAAANGGDKKHLVAVRPETIAEPVVEGFFVARMAGEAEAQRHRMTEDQARPIRHVRPRDLYDEKLPDLPTAYEDDALVLLPRDPHTLFVFWDFRPETKRVAREGLKDPKTIIRLFDRGTLVREVDFALESRSFYLHSLTAGRRYHVEIYCLGVDGQARRLGRPSNSIELPPDGVSHDTSVRFLRIPWGFPLTRLKELGQQGVATFEVPPLERRYRVWRRIPLPGSDSLLQSEEFVERTAGERHIAAERLLPDTKGHFTGSSDQVIPGSSDRLVRGAHKAGEER